MRRAPGVATVTSAWSAPAAEAKDLVSKDGKTGLIVAGLTGGENAEQNSAQQLSDEVTREHPAGAGGVTVRTGGTATVGARRRTGAVEGCPADSSSRVVVMLEGSDGRSRVMRTPRSSGAK